MLVFAEGGKPITLSSGNITALEELLMSHKKVGFSLEL